MEMIRGMDGEEQTAPAAPTAGLRPARGRSGTTCIVCGVGFEVPSSCVNGQQVLPSGGHEISPRAAERPARWRPEELPRSAFLCGMDHLLF